MSNLIKTSLLLGLSGALLMACSDSTGTNVQDDTSAPVEAAQMIERIDQIMIMEGGLSGLYRNAGEGTPVMLIVPGSGPTDQNGNSPLGIKANSYGLLADGLQAEGISTLRVDKRGQFSSANAGDPNAVSVDLYAEDYVNWAAKLSSDAGQDCIWLLGHSEGGLMVLAAAAKDSSNICGLILAAAPGRPMGDVLRDQLRANPANEPVLDDAIGAIEALEAGETVDVSAFHPGLRGLFNPVIQDYLISLFAVDPAQLVAEVDVPILVLQGDRDLQISVDDAELLVEAGADLVLLPTVNHLLKVSPEDQAGNYATYSDPDLPLAETVVPAIAAFVK